MHILRTIFRPIHPLPFIPTTVLFRPLYAFAQTSRQVEHRMRDQRNKSLSNQFKALSSHFGLNRPASISSDFPKPSTYEYTITSLRRNSHMFPQYLLSELNKPKSQYYQVLESLFDSLGNVDNKEAIEFLEFLISWRIYRQNVDYQQILLRKIYGMKLNLGEVFRLLKAIVQIEEKELKEALLLDVENKLLAQIVDIQHHQYESLFRILNFMRIHDLSPKVKPEITKGILKQEQIDAAGEESFFKIVQSVLLRNLEDIPLPSLVQMIVHYASNVKESQDDRLQILGRVQHRIIDNLPFLTHDQLIAVMYSYLKTETQSERLINQFVRRVELLYFEISWANKRKILSLASSLPHDKWLYVVGLSIHQVLKGKKVAYQQGRVQNDPNAKEVEHQLLPSIYLSAYEANLITAELVDKLQPRILQNIFNYPAEDVGLITWLFTITPASLSPKRENRDMLYTKVQSVLVGGFNGGTFTLKDISMVVWSLCNYAGKSNMVYKENADFWKNIESYIQQRIGNKKEERLLNGCCQILWAYINNKSLTIKTINMITDVIIEHERSGALVEELFNFELVTITSFYYSLRASLPASLFNYIETLSLKYFRLLLPEMDYLQILKMLKCILTGPQGQLQSTVIEQSVWGEIIDQFLRDADRVQYGYLMGVVGYTIVSPQGRAAEQRAVQIVTKLMARKKQLEQLKPATAQV